MSDLNQERESKLQYQVRDKPAEKGLTINNILLAILVIGGTAFSTVLINDMKDIKQKLSESLAAVIEIRVQDAEVARDISHVMTVLDSCREYHREVEKRLDNLEKK